MVTQPALSYKYLCRNLEMNPPRILDRGSREQDANAYSRTYVRESWLRRHVDVELEVSRRGM